MVLNVAAVNPSARTFITAWPAGEDRPLAASLNVPAGDVRANLVFVKVGVNGPVSFYNNPWDVDLLADVADSFGPTGDKHHRVSQPHTRAHRRVPGPRRHRRRAAPRDPAARARPSPARDGGSGLTRCRR